MDSSPSSMPAELQQSPPRAVARKPGTLAPLTLVGLYLCVPHVWIGLWLLATFLGTASVAAFGKDITGRVTEAKSERTSKGHLVHKLTYVYAFHGVVYTHHSEFMGGSGVLAEPGAEIALRVRSGDDAAPLEVGDTLSRQVAHLGFFSLFWNFAVIVLGLVVLKPLWHRWLVRRGRVAQGRIESVKDYGNRGTHRHVRYTFTPVGTTRAVAARVLVTQVEADLLAAGGQGFPVLYWERLPRVCVVYPLANYQAVTQGALAR